MSSLARMNAGVQPVRLRSGVSEADHAWWAAACAEADEPAPVVVTDLDWIYQESAAYLERAVMDEDEDSRERYAFIANVVGSLCGSLAFHGTDSASVYLASPHTRFEPLTRFPQREWRSGLGAWLAGEAAWYAHLDHPAADLVAGAILVDAESAEHFEADTPTDLVSAEALDAERRRDAAAIDAAASAESPLW